MSATAWKHDTESQTPVTSMAGSGRAGQGRAHLHHMRWQCNPVCTPAKHHKQCQRDSTRQVVDNMRSKLRQICQTILKQRANLAGKSCQGKPMQEVDTGDGKLRGSGLGSIT